MTALEVFQFQTDRVRTVLIEGEPWFVIGDVCKALDIANPTDAATRLDGDDLGTTEVIDSIGRARQTRITNESGFYDLVFQSRKPEARAFRRWVTRDVLPTLRRQGFYGMHPELTVYSFDEAATLIEQRTGRPMSVSNLVKLMKAGGVLKQNGSPATKYRAWFWHTGLTYAVHPHQLSMLMHKVCEADNEMREFQAMQMRLAADGVGQLELPPA